MLFVLFWRGVKIWGRPGWKEGSAESKERRKRDYCIADANEGTWGWSGKEGKGRRERERQWELRKGC